MATPALAAPSKRLAAIAASLALFTVAVPTARANGDPPSDVLPFKQVYLPFGADLDPATTGRLLKALSAATRRGYQIKVAIVADVIDMGSVTVLWRHPRNYARFLGEELVFPRVHNAPDGARPYRKRLLVLMPNGFGFNYPNHSSVRAYKQLAEIKIGAGANALVVAATRAVQRLASAKA